MPRVSIITINYGSEKVTLELLESLKYSLYTDFEVIVVDNHSPSGAPTQLPILFPDVILILNKENSGFAGGNNIATQVAKGEYCFYINNDAEVLPDTIGNLVSVLDSMPDVGAVSPKIKFFYKPNTLQYAGYEFATYSKLESWFAVKDRSSTLYGLPMFYIKVRGASQVDVGQFDEDADTPYLHGAAMMVRRSVIEKAGLMYEPYFLFYEELDWSVQLRKAGYRLRYVHHALVMHKESVSSGKESPLKSFLINRNRGVFLRRNAPARMRFVCFFYFLFVALPLNCFNYLKKKEFALAYSVVRAWSWNVLHIFDCFYKKKYIL